jgi:predicted Zn-ribbon and HTH transcriptional regulator
VIILQHQKLLQQQLWHSQPINQIQNLKKTKPKKSMTDNLRKLKKNAKRNNSQNMSKNKKIKSQQWF